MTVRTHSLLHSASLFLNPRRAFSQETYKVGFFEQQRLQKIVRKAILDHNPAAVKLAIDKGAPINKQDLFATDGHNDYHIVRAAYEGKECNKIAEILIRAGVNVNATCLRGHSPLLVASRTRNPELVQSLLEAGADVNQADVDGRTPLMEASATTHKTIADLLVALGADQNATDHQGNTPLILAIKSYSCQLKLVRDIPDSSVLELIRNLITPSNINAMNQMGRTALMEAVSNGYFDIVKLLLASGADQSIQAPHAPFLDVQLSQYRNHSGETAHSLAVKGKEKREELHERYQKIITLLSDAQSKNAGEPSYPEFLRLFTRGAKSAIDIGLLKICIAKLRNNREEKHIAFQEEQEAITPEDIENTDLMKAAEKGELEIVKLLIDSGASPHLRNNLGKTALDIALWRQQHTQKEIDGYADLIDNVLLGQLKSWL